MHEDTIESRIARGMAVLDDTWGPRWDTTIDLETLDLGEGEYCILGQLEGGFSRACDMLFDDEDDERSLENSPAYYGFDREYWFSYDSLTEAWKAAITARRAQRGEQ